MGGERFTNAIQNGFKKFKSWYICPHLVLRNMLWPRASDLRYRTRIALLYRAFQFQALVRLLSEIILLRVSELNFGSQFFGKHIIYAGTRKPKLCQKVLHYGSTENFQDPSVVFRSLWIHRSEEKVQTQIRLRSI